MMLHCPASETYCTRSFSAPAAEADTNHLTLCEQTRPRDQEDPPPNGCACRVLLAARWSSSLPHFFILLPRFLPPTLSKHTERCTCAGASGGLFGFGSGSVIGINPGTRAMSSRQESDSARAPVPTEISEKTENPDKISGNVQNQSPSRAMIPLGKPKSGRVWKDRNKQRYRYTHTYLTAYVTSLSICSSGRCDNRVQHHRDFYSILKPRLLNTPIFTT